MEQQADDGWIIAYEEEVQPVDGATSALALDIDPRRRRLELGAQIRSGGGPQLWHNAVTRRFFPGEAADWGPAVAWLRTAEAAALRARIAAGYRGEMLWTGDWIGEWTEDAWEAAEFLAAGVGERLG